MRYLLWCFFWALVAYEYHDQPISISLRNEAKLWSLIRYVLLAEVRPSDPTQDPDAPEQREPCQECDHLYRGRHGSVHHHVWSNLRRSAQWSHRWGISTRVREVPQHRFRQGRHLNRIDHAFNLDSSWGATIFENLVTLSRLIPLPRLIRTRRVYPCRENMRNAMLALQLILINFLIIH